MRPIHPLIATPIATIAIGIAGKVPPAGWLYLTLITIWIWIAEFTILFIQAVGEADEILLAD